MSSRGETTIGAEQCLRLDRHSVTISIDQGRALPLGVHVRIRGEGGELLSHLAATPARARAIAALLVQGADRLDPPAPRAIDPECCGLLKGGRLCPGCPKREAAKPLCATCGVRCDQCESGPCVKPEAVK